MSNSKDKSEWGRNLGTRASSIALYADTMQLVHAFVAPSAIEVVEGRMEAIREGWVELELVATVTNLDKHD